MASSVPPPAANLAGTPVNLSDEIPKPQLNQKDCVKLHVKQYLERLEQQQSPVLNEPINCSTLRDIIIPRVRREMSLSYGVGPKLMYDWCLEVNDQWFQSKYKFKYVASGAYRARGGRTTLTQQNTPSSTQPISPPLKQEDNSQGDNSNPPPSTVEHKTEFVPRSEYEQLKSMYQQLLNSYTSQVDHHNTERQHLLSQISKYDIERQQLIHTIMALTKQSSTDTHRSQKKDNLEPERKRKRYQDESYSSTNNTAGFVVNNNGSTTIIPMISHNANHNMMLDLSTFSSNNTLTSPSVYPFSSTNGSSSFIHSPLAFNSSIPKNSVTPEAGPSSHDFSETDNANIDSFLKSNFF